jgi:hypothetical protein
VQYRNQADPAAAGQVKPSPIAQVLTPATRDVRCICNVYVSGG